MSGIHLRSRVMKITVQQLEALLRGGELQVTDTGKSLLVDSNVGSVELSYDCLETFEPRLADPEPEEPVCLLPEAVELSLADHKPVVDPHAETRKMEKPPDEDPEKLWYC